MIFSCRSWISSSSGVMLLLYPLWVALASLLGLLNSYEALQNQLTTLNKNVDDLLEVQRKKVEGQEQKLAQLDSELKYTQAFAENIIDLTFSVASVNPPWVLEEWAKDITDKFKTAE